VDLEKGFSEEEVKKGIDESYAEWAPGPDGFSFLFYQRLWDMKIYRFNFAMIILIPKEEEAGTLKKYRPIGLINYHFKIFSKVLNNRM
jgi:hypothetical protein